MLKKNIIGICSTLLLTLFAAEVYSDDTDIFLGKDSAGARGVKSSNLFFLLDTSSSMSWLPATEPGSTEIKMDILKEAMTDILAIKGVDDTLRNINVGIGTFYSPAGVISYPIRPIDDPGIIGGTVRDEIISLVNGLTWDDSWGTPLASAYYESMAYMFGRPVLFGLSARDYGSLVDNGHRGELLSHPQSFDTSVPPNYNFTGIVDQVCATNSILLLSDGQATVQGYAEMIANDPLFSNDLPVDANDGQPCDASWGDFERCGRELADYAFRRLDSTDPDAPPVFTHTIGFDIASDSAAESYLQDVAQAGGGQYFRARNKDDLIRAFLNVTNRVAETTSAFSAPVVPSNTTNRLYSSSEVYLNLFKTERKPIWAGNIKKFGLCEPGQSGCSAGQYIGSNGQPATDSNGELLPNGVADLWDSGNDPAASDVMSGGLASKVVDWTQRNIYTWTAPDYPTTIDTSANPSNRGWDLYLIDHNRTV